MQKQVLETNEEIQEKRRHVKEIEAKLNTTIKESSAKAESVAALTVQLAAQATQLVEVKTQEATKFMDLQ